MNRRKNRTVAWLIVLCLALALTPAAAGTDGEDSIDAQAVSDYWHTATDNEWRTLDMINGLRAEYGLDPLVLLEPLQAAAATRSSELEEAFLHLRPDGRGWDTALSEAGLPTEEAAEMIARPFISALGVFTRWSGSEDEREILLGDYNYIGISHNISNDSWCALLIKGEEPTGLSLDGSGIRTIYAEEPISSLEEYALVDTVYGPGYFMVTDELVTGVNIWQAGAYTATLTLGELSVSFPLEVWFLDVDYNLWYHSYIRYVVQIGLFNGVSSTEFAPDATMTRAMFVTAVGRYAEQLGVEMGVFGDAAHFSDVEQGTWYSPYINWATASGITQGYGAEFGVDDMITREQVAEFIRRFALWADIELPEVEQPYYSDRHLVEDYAVGAVDTAVALGMIDLGPYYTFQPQAHATRAESAKALTILLRDYQTTLEEEL